MRALSRSELAETTYKCVSCRAQELLQTGGSIVTGPTTF
jgi:hypothetical protein